MYLYSFQIIQVGYMESIAEQLKKARKNLSLTQEQLADMSNIRQATISRIESGKNPYMYVHTLQHLQKALKINFII